MEQIELVKALLDEMEKRKPIYQKYQDYYEGEHSILHEPRKVDGTQNDMRGVFNYCRKVVNNATGYILGKPVSYQSKSGDRDFINEIEKWFSYWEKKQNIRLKEYTEIFGVAYEIASSTPQGEFKCDAFSPLEVITIHDGTMQRNTSLAVRKYQKPFDDTVYVDVWNQKNVSRYKLSGTRSLEFIETKAHLFDRCPVTEVINNSSSKSTFHDIIKIVELYNAVMSASANEILDHRTAYLVIEGATIELDEAIKMKENGIILAPPGSKVYWATKDINNSFVKEMLKDWQDEMFIQTNQVNLNENFQSNTSGVSIRLKLQELENLSAIKESMFEEALMRRMQLFCYWLKEQEGLKHDWKDIRVTFSRNIPVDEKSITDMIVALEGMVPLEDLLSWHPKISNPQLTAEKLNKEKAENGAYTLKEHLEKVDKDESTE